MINRVSKLFDWSIKKFNTKTDFVVFVYAQHRKVSLLLFQKQNCHWYETEERGKRGRVRVGVSEGQKRRERERDNDECGSAVLIVLPWLAVSSRHAKPQWFMGYLEIAGLLNVHNPSHPAEREEKGWWYTGEIAWAWIIPHTTHESKKRENSEVVRRAGRTEKWPEEEGELGWRGEWVLMNAGRWKVSKQRNRWDRGLDKRKTQ